MKNVDVLVNNGVNVQKSLEIFGEMEMYDESLGDFLGEVDDKLTKIKEYKETGDMANYAILVHSLKSDAKYFGFEKLAELAYAHELKSKENNVAFVLDNYNDLVNETNRIISVVKNYLGEEPLKVSEVSQDNTNHKTILVVDDSNIIRNYVQKVFVGTYEVLAASDGEEAINMIKDSGKHIAGVLLDLNMPKVDGFAVLDYFKENNLFSKIPVSIITGNDVNEIDQRAFKYPIVDILKKPFNERDVKSVVERTMMYSNIDY